MKPGGFVRAVMLAGFLFLWLPILLLVGFAFSADRIPFQWGGFSLRWFGALATNERLLEAAWLSLRIAAASATLAVLMGGGITFALARFGPFRGRALFGALAGAPLVLPEVVIGLSLLLLFVALEGLIGWPAGRGAFTILLAPCRLWRGLRGGGGAGPAGRGRTQPGRSGDGLGRHALCRVQDHHPALDHARLDRGLVVGLHAVAG